MALPRRSIASWATLLRQRSTATLRAANARQAGRQSRARGYASSSGGGAAKKSDLPWCALRPQHSWRSIANPLIPRLFGAVGVTAPALWYIGIWKPDPNSHHDHEGHGEHDESNADEGEEAAGEQGESEEDKGDDNSSKDDKEGGTKDDAKIDPVSA
jgi:hypothetical protein